MAGGQRVIPGGRHGGTAGQGRGSSSPDNNPYNVGRCGQPHGWRAAGLSPAVAGVGQPGKDADRRARTRTPYNVGRAAGRVAGGRRAIGGVRLGGTVGQGRGSSSPDKNPVQRGAVYNVG